MPTLAAVTLSDPTSDSPTIDVSLSYEKADALVNFIARNSADLPAALTGLLSGLTSAADAALDTMLTATFGPDGMDALAAA
jgi:hypothetical protein